MEINLDWEREYFISVRSWVYASVSFHSTGCGREIQPQAPRYKMERTRRTSGVVPKHLRVPPDSPLAE